MSHLEKKRTQFQPKLPKFLKDLSQISFEDSGSSPRVDPEIQKRFPKTKDQKIAEVHKKKQESKPLKVGVVFSGGQAAGGHNVITGLFDALKKMNPKSELWGFLDGPIGIIENKLTELTADKLKPYRNIGGFDLIGSGRTKIESEEQFAASLKTATDQNLDGIVVIGGDDSNTNAALLAEYFLENGCKTQVIGVPKTIDGDLKNEYIEVSFGFDTACKVYSEMIGNIGRDALSAKKYYHFVKLMGRSASHIALECALNTQPNWTFIGEEVAAKKYTLSAIAKQLADLIEKRSVENKNYGVILIPEGLIEFIPEVKKLIQELNHLLAEGDSPDVAKVKSLLSEESSKCLSLLPERLQEQFLLDRDPHGNVQVSHIETEKLFIEIAKEELKTRNFSGKLNAVQHFFGYEGRAGFPSNFDAQYCYALGHVAALLLESGHTGYISCVTNLKRPAEDWGGLGLPITMFMNMETRHGKEKPVIRKALVDLNGSAFKTLEKNREKWALNDEYLCPGSIQFEGEPEITDTTPVSL